MTEPTATDRADAARDDAPGRAVNGAAVSDFRLGLFGDTRSGKTIYLTALYGSANDGGLPQGFNVLPTPGCSLEHLQTRLAMIRAGRWPPGDLDTAKIELQIGYRGKTFALRTNDFQGGRFGDLTTPESKRAFETFVRELFEGCSAYLLLVDPGVLKRANDASLASHERESAQREMLRVTSAVEVAAEMVRATGLVSRRLHRPVAVVFTKCDMHEDVRQDPSGFAQKHLHAVWRHLKQHAPRRHGYFAVSSTGRLAENQRPPTPLAPLNLTQPLSWCLDQHLNRFRILWWMLAGVACVLLAACYLLLWRRNTQAVEDIRGQIAAADQRRLPELFDEADGLARSWLVPLTPPWSALPTRHAVAAEARRRFQDDLAGRCDDSDNLRGVNDYQEAARRAEAFRRDYPGTAEAEDIAAWLRDQRERLGKRLAAEIETLARQGKEMPFNEKLKEYGVLPTAECDVRVAAAKRVLDGNVVRRKVSLLFDARISRPGQIAEIRQKCKEAEQEIGARGLPPGDVQVQYVAAVRELYDELDRKTARRPIHFKLHAAGKNKLRWDLNRNTSGDDDLLAQESYRAPSADPNDPDWRILTSPEIPVDLFETKRLLLYAWEDTWGGNGLGTLTVRLRDVRFGKPQEFKTNEGTRLFVTFFDDGGIAGFFGRVAKIEELEDQLFRASAAG